MTDITYICKHTYTQTHTHTHKREGQLQTDRQTDRRTQLHADMQIDWQTHTHMHRTISESYLPQLKWVNTELCLRDISSLGRREGKWSIKLVCNTSIWTVTHKVPLVTNTENHACLLYNHIPFLRAQPHSQPPTWAHSKHPSVKSLC